MKQFIAGFILGAFVTSSIVLAGQIASPPPFGDINPALQHYLREIYDNIHIPPVTTTAPNNSRRGREGAIVIYNNSGTYELWIKTNVDSTDWDKIGP